MEYILWFEKISKEMVPLVGGKGANLGEMSKLNLPVPQGFAITTKAFDRFLEANRINEQIEKLIDECDAENTNQLLETSKKIKELIISKEYPPMIRSELIESYKELSFTDQVVTPRAIELIASGREYALVAVRSSATAEDLPTASFAGQQATFLNVKGIKEYLESVKKCWASLYEPRAIFYRNKQGFKRASISVIIQRMVNSDASGVMFTTNPTTGEDNIIIEACWGLGETLVQGEVEPDRYIVSKDGKILEKKVGKKERMMIRDYVTDRTVKLLVPKNKINVQVLTDQEILSIVNYGLKIEGHYGKPQDIEFAVERGRIFIVQTRAVTTKARKEEMKEIEGEPILKGLAVSPGTATGVVRIVHGLEDINKVQQGDILVTRMTSPDLVPTMSKSAAIITDSGGATCHAAIVSREMGIPAIVGTETATQKLKDGDIVTVDAYHGLVYPGQTEVEKPQEVAEAEEETPIEFDKIITTSIKVNLVFPERVEEVAKKVDGVGLLRIEHMITKAGIHPAKLIREGRAEDYIKILIDGIKPIAKPFHPKPVWVRTLDARSDEFRNLEGGAEEPKEDNPMLGWHGIRRSLDEPELLKAEFEAVKRLHEEGLTNVHIMLPFVISVEEFRAAREIAKEIELPETVKIGIMVETPAAALTIQDFCKEGIDFVSFGTNDLSQLVLGVDRNNSKLASLFTETHPAVKKMIKYVIKVCKSYQVESSVCGEAPSNTPQFVEFLVRSGIDSISANIDAIDRVKSTVIKTEKKLLLEALREK
jgi:pyruvate,water dikinase